jgi:hypothetical protein
MTRTFLSILVGTVLLSSVAAMAQDPYLESDAKVDPFYDFQNNKLVM